MFSKMRLAKKVILIFYVMPLCSWATCDATIESIQQGVDNLSGSVSYTHLTLPTKA